ncbi:hypothetical protein AAHA92_12420 [Salvia divinorum]|uniref:Uncharacterized protein n=1 Tax=Salvia divinorum TaxID=28513 RepID=A0ABD1HKB7_SALDI
MRGSGDSRKRAKEKVGGKLKSFKLTGKVAAYILVDILQGGEECLWNLIMLLEEKCFLIHLPLTLLWLFLQWLTNHAASAPRGLFVFSRLL